MTTTFRVSPAKLNDGFLFEAHLDRTYRTSEEADAIVALFPKSVKVWATTLDGITETGSSELITHLVMLRVILTANSVTGAVNETGTRRVRAFLRTIRANGFEIVEPMGYRNSVTLAEFEASI